MDWMKLWHDYRTDRKMTKFTMSEIGCLTYLFLLSSEQEERGTIPADKATDREYMANECSQDDEALLSATIEKAIRWKIMAISEDGALAILNFQKRQANHGRPPSAQPEAVAERQRRWRERHANEDVTTSNESNDVTKRGDNELTTHNDQIRLDGDGEETRGEERRESSAVANATRPRKAPTTSQAMLYEAMMAELTAAGRADRDSVPDEIVKKQIIIMAGVVKKLGPAANHDAMVRQYTRYLIKTRPNPIDATQVSAGIEAYVQAGCPADPPARIQGGSNGQAAPAGKYNWRRVDATSTDAA